MNVTDYNIKQKRNSLYILAPIFNLDQIIWHF